MTIYTKYIMLSIKNNDAGLKKFNEKIHNED